MTGLSRKNGGLETFEKLVRQVEPDAENGQPRPLPGELPCFEFDRVFFRGQDHLGIRPGHRGRDPGAGRRRVQMMIGEGHPADDSRSERFQLGEEAAGTGDAGECQDAFSGKGFERNARLSVR